MKLSSRLDGGVTWAGTVEERTGGKLQCVCVCKDQPGKKELLPWKSNWETAAKKTLCAGSTASNRHGADLGLVWLCLEEKELMKYLDRHTAMIYLTLLLSILDFAFSRQNSSARRSKV